MFADPVLDPFLNKFSLAEESRTRIVSLLESIVPDVFMNFFPGVLERLQVIMTLCPSASYGFITRSRCSEIYL